MLPRRPSSDLELEQARAEADLEPVRHRLVRNEQRIADGTVADPKALAGMVEEVEHLRKRISDLEDAELEVMEQLETGRGAGEAAGACRPPRRGLAAVAAKRNKQLAEFAATWPSGGPSTGRPPGSGACRPVALYDQGCEPRRCRRGGAAAGPLHGLPVEINAADVRVIVAAPADEVFAARSAAGSWSAPPSPGL